MIELNNYKLILHEKYLKDLPQSKKRSYQDYSSSSSSSSSVNDDNDDQQNECKKQKINNSNNDGMKKSFLICDILGLEKVDTKKSPTSTPTTTTNSLKRSTNFDSEFSLENLLYKKICTENNKNNQNEMTTTKKKDVKDEAKMSSSNKETTGQTQQNLWPAWVYCTRYSDRPSAGPRQKRKAKAKTNNTALKFSSSTSTSSLSSSQSSTYKQTRLDDEENISYADENDHQHEHEHKKEKHIVEDEDDDELVDDELIDDLDDDDDNDSLKSSNGNKRPRTAFTSSQLNRLKDEFDKCKYLTGEKRQYLANELNLNESQIKIWFQNKRAKIKKSTGVKNNLALQLMAQGLYNHKK